MSKLNKIELDKKKCVKTQESATSLKPNKSIHHVTV